MANTTGMGSSREFDLLLLCCACAYDPARLADVRDAAQHCDVDRLGQLASRHRVEGLIWDTLTKAGISLPSPGREQIKAQSQLRQAQNLRSAASLIDIATAAEASKLDILLVKGLATAALAYVEPAARTARDIDLLVAVENIGRVATLLGTLGYSPTIPRSAHEQWHRSRKESVWESRDGMIVELHSRLADNRRLIPTIGMGSARQAVRIGDRQIETLGPSELIAYSCVHGSSSMWFRLKWVVDLAALLWARHGTQPADQSYEDALRLGAGRAASLGFALSHMLMATSLSASLVERLHKDPIVARLTRTSLRLMHGDEPTGRRLGTLPIRTSQPWLMPGPTAAIGEVRRQIGEVVQNRLSAT